MSSSARTPETCGTFQNTLGRNKLEKKTFRIFLLWCKIFSHKVHNIHWYSYGIPRKKYTVALCYTIYQTNFPRNRAWSLLRCKQGCILRGKSCAHRFVQETGCVRGNCKITGEHDRLCVTLELRVSVGSFGSPRMSRLSSTITLRFPGKRVALPPVGNY